MPVTKSWYLVIRHASSRPPFPLHLLLSMFQYRISVQYPNCLIGAHFIPRLLSRQQDDAFSFLSEASTRYSQWLQNLDTTRAGLVGNTYKANQAMTLTQWAKFPYARGAWGDPKLLCPQGRPSYQRRTAATSAVVRCQS